MMFNCFISPFWPGVAVRSAASPPAALAAVTSTWMVPPSTCQTTTPTAAPATSTRRKPLTPSKHSDCLIPRFPPPLATTRLIITSTSSTCDLRTVPPPEKILDVTIVFFFFSISNHWLDRRLEWWAVFSKAGWSAPGSTPPPFFICYHCRETPAHIPGGKPPVLQSHGGKWTTLPLSALLWQAAHPGSSPGHVSSQRHNITPPPSSSFPPIRREVIRSAYWEITHRCKVLFIHMKLSMCAVGGGCEVYTHQLCNVCECTPYWKCRTTRKRVSLWCCCKCSAHLLCKSHPILDSLPPPSDSVQNGKAQKRRGCFFLLLHESPSDVQTVCCSASTLQHYRNN